jgi:hypothetical protein
MPGVSQYGFAVVCLRNDWSFMLQQQHVLAAANNNRLAEAGSAL